MGGDKLTNHAGSMSKLKVLQKMAGIFFSPTKTFGAIDRKPDWIVPVAVILLITLVLSFIANPILLPLRKDRILESMEMNGATREQMDNMSENIDRTARFDFIFSAARLIVKLLILTLLVWSIHTVVLGRRETFQKAFSLYTYSYLPWILGIVLVVILMVIQKSPDIHFSLAMFLPDDMWGTFLFRFLRTIGVFSIWHFVVLAIGCSVIFKFDLKKNIGSTIVLLLIYIPAWAILTMFLS